MASHCTKDKNSNSVPGSQEDLHGLPLATFPTLSHALSSCASQCGALTSSQFSKPTYSLCSQRLHTLLPPSRTLSPACLSPFPPVSNLNATEASHHTVQSSITTPDSFPSWHSSGLITEWSIFPFLKDNSSSVHSAQAMLRLVLEKTLILPPI